MAESFSAVLRKAKGSATQADFAVRLGVTESRLSRWLRGDALPHDDALPYLAERLGVAESRLRRLVERDRKSSTAALSPRKQAAELTTRLARIESQLDRLLRSLGVDPSDVA